MKPIVIAFVLLTATSTLAASPQTRQAVRPTTAPVVKTFDKPDQAADALMQAADRFDVPELQQLFGGKFKEVLLTNEPADDRRRAREFVAKFREKHSIAIDPKLRGRAFLLVGSEDWPFPIPIVKRGTKWSFDTLAGRRELLYRRVGSNELDAMAICRGYVEAQHEYALKKRQGYDVNQYAQRIIASAGKQDGLAWQKPDGSWDGPVGQKAAEAIAQGYSRGEPYHGYYFKVLKGQGPAAPLGQLDYVVKGAMIGGFALVASPAEYGVTGVKTFIVSQDGVVYEKDFGRTTKTAFARMERFNPDRSWKPVLEE